MNLGKKINNWQEADLITRAQGESILAFEKNKDKPKFLSGMIFLSIFCIGLGIISLIAANWQAIPAGLKLGLDILILSAIAWGIFETYKRNLPLKMEALIITYALMILASIGLVGQVYQLQPQSLMAYFIWALLTSPLLFFTKKLILPIFWIPIFIFSGLDRLAQFEWFYNLFNIIEKSFPFAMSLCCILAIMLMYVVVKRFADIQMPKLVYALGFWLAVIITGNVVFMDFAAGNIWGNWLLSWEQYTYNYWVIGGLAIGVVILISLTKLWKNNILLPAIISFLLIFDLAYYFLPSISIAFKLWGVLLTLGTLGLLIQYAHKNGQVKLFNIASALIGLRLFIVYLQVFGSLMSTGVGLLSSGLVLLLIILGWNKLKTAKKGA